ncbi:MAG: ABC transporter ATP-binding protein [Deltaproteobacteria bacterium]|nr:MAG: ABC transporter ATP-binding protein [Deltaproteobacteria bacterium]
MTIDAGDVVIRTEGLRKVYRTGFWMRRVVGLESLDLEVRRGEVFGIVGPNGAGKTTTIKILTGLQAATSGHAWILGQPYDVPATRQKLGFLPERPYFYEHLSARELLDFYGRLFGVERARRQRRIDELLERVDLTRFADVALRKYSKGMVQRVGLCQALLHDPELIILDEPMSGLDPLGRALVRDVILEERARGCSVCFSSHILSDVEALSDRVAIIVKGRLRGVGTVEELIGHRVRYVELRYQGAVDPGGTLLREDDRGRVVRLAPDEADRAVAAVVRAGGRVLELVPVRETLESVLLDEVDAAAPVDEKRMGVL